MMQATKKGDPKAACWYGMGYFSFFGLPPFFPFSRAATAFFSVRMEPRARAAVIMGQVSP